MYALLFLTEIFVLSFIWPFHDQSRDDYDDEAVKVADLCEK